MVAQKDYLDEFNAIGGEELESEEEKLVEKLKTRKSTKVKDN